MAGRPFGIMNIMKMRKWYVVLIALAVIAIAWGIGARIFVAQKASGPESPLASVSFAYYTNAKGQPWAIPTGASNFTVSSKETYPRFVLGTIDPTKVSIGDTQHMQIVVRDNVPLVKVWAEVENDKGIDSIPLTLGASSTVSYNTIENQKYLVGDDGKLVVNDGGNKTPAIVALIQSLFQKASAEQAVDYSYSGIWSVHDTQTITYHTTFYAIDAQNRTTKLVLAWSDPCSLGSNGYLQADCSLTSATDGTDGVSTNLQSFNLTLNSGGLYVVNPGYSITINSGSITFNGGSVNTNEYLYYTDADGDQYAANGTKSANAASSWSGHIRSSSYAHGGTFDCNDTLSGANQSDTNWWNALGSNWASGYSAGDYNCDGTVSYGWAINTGASNYTPANVSTVAAAGTSAPTLCTNTGSVFYAASGGSPSYEINNCGSDPMVTPGSIFYVSSGGACNGGTTYWGYGTPIAVCK